MKKILEIVKQDNGMISFNTDIDLAKNPSMIPQLNLEFAFNMMTELRGRNEQAVIGIIRSLALADLSVCIHRKDMVRFLDEGSQQLSEVLQETIKELEQKGLFKRCRPDVRCSKTIS